MDSVRQHIDGAFSSREDDAAAIFRALDKGTDLDADIFGDSDPTEVLDNLALSAETETHLVITLSTGGPHEEIDAVVQGGEVIRATFRALWGSDTITRTLSDNDALWRLAQHYAEVLLP